ncbi:MAG: 2TM domain-containing protein [Candidatus Dojkabacteria bacterium]|nr:2TM domain-containing protein [Candidatus Dojkabacteria bacterium]MDQ7020504.1 2TM domain-containing protein [Candidatus Dojkabacteria bacterium]
MEETKIENIIDNDKTINSLVDMDHELEEKARRRAREKGSLIAHTFIFILGSLGLFIYNAITAWNDWSNWWFLPVVGGWFIGYIIHFLSTTLFNGLVANYIETTTEKELEKESKKL